MSAAALLGGTLMMSPALGADDHKYPTLDEVKKAKGNAAAAKAEYARITAALQGLQEAATEAAADQLKKQVEYTIAEQALQAATKKADDLQAQADDAKQASSEASKRYGRLVSQMYVTGGQNVTTQLLLQPGSSDDLLQKLGTMKQLTAQSSTLQNEAEQKANLAGSLSKQAAKAEQVRTGLAADAQKKLAAAQAATQRAQEAVAAQKKKSEELYHLAAVLQGKSDAVEKKYQEGVAYRAAVAKAKAEAAARQAAQAAKAAANGSADRLYLVAQGINADPAAAQAYARGRLASYGWGSDQWSCLYQLWTIESGWRVNAYNPSSAAYGIPQALPATKMATYGSDWMTSYVTQINWGLDYIRSSYSTPCGALNFETSHTPYWY